MPPSELLRNKPENSLMSTMRVHSTSIGHTHQINDPSEDFCDGFSANIWRTHKTFIPPTTGYMHMHSLSRYTYSTLNLTFSFTSCICFARWRTNILAATYFPSLVHEDSVTNHQVHILSYFISQRTFHS